MSAISPGLCSVTFRKLAPTEIIDLAVKAGLKGIEWAGDVHVEPGDVATARRVSAQCTDAGISVPSLGSYFRAGATEKSQEFEPVLDSCLALGASNIRIWAGDEGFDVLTQDARKRVADKVAHCCELASAQNVSVSLEYHPNTLTDSLAGARWILDAVDHANCFTYWQPVSDQSVADCLADLEAIAEALSHVHVFFWIGEKVRRPLSEGAEYWRSILSALHDADGGEEGRISRFPGGRWAFLEFVRDDDISQFRRDAAVLRTLTGHFSDTEPNARAGA